MSNAEQIRDSDLSGAFVKGKLQLYKTYLKHNGGHTLRNHNVFPFKVEDNHTEEELYRNLFISPL